MAGLVVALEKELMNMVAAPLVKDIEVGLATLLLEMRRVGAAVLGRSEVIPPLLVLAVLVG